MGPAPPPGLYWLAVDAAGYALVAPALNRVRVELGLPPVRRLFRWWLSPDRVIGLFPGWYAAPQPDWPPQLRLAGFGRYDGATGELPEDVRRFCVAGSPPIAFTLGTGMTHAAGFFRTAVAACDAIGARGLLVTKYPDVIPARLPPRVRHCAFAPFRQLFRRCGAVVHHGGVGTTAAALEAGCPQLVLPLAWDQPDNAARVVRLGVGLALGPRRRSRGHLSRALARLTAPEVGGRCRAVASRAPLFFRHDTSGSPSGIGYDGPRISPRFPVGPLREAVVGLAETPRRWFWQAWGCSNSGENLHRIGGEPCWVKDAEYPRCPTCDNVMTFLLELDSELPMADGGEWLWGSGGIAYGFWCGPCGVSGFLWQCT